MLHKQVQRLLDKSTQGDSAFVLYNKSHIARFDMLLVWKNLNLRYNLSALKTMHHPPLEIWMSHFLCTLPFLSSIHITDIIIQLIRHITETTQSSPRTWWFQQWFEQLQANLEIYLSSTDWVQRYERYHTLIGQNSEASIIGSF